MTDRVLAVYRPPFTLNPHVYRFEQGMSLYAMRAGMRELPLDFDEYGQIAINGNFIPKAFWYGVKPKFKSDVDGNGVAVTFHYAPQGGNKEALALVAAIGLTVLTGGIAAGWAVPLLGSSFAAGTLGATLLAGGVSLAGSLLLSALTAPPTVTGGGAQEARSRREPGAAAVSGNVLAPGAAIPRVIGERKVYPPLVMEPYVYFDGQTEVAEACFALAGPHQITDIRVNDAPIGSIGDIEYEVRNGFPGEPGLTMLTKQSITQTIGNELTAHILNSDGMTLDMSGGNVSAVLPQGQTVVTRNKPDMHVLDFVLGQGLYVNTDNSIKLDIPIRVRMRPLGSTTWKNLPELIYRRSTVNVTRLSIKLLWNSAPNVTPTVSSANGFVLAKYNSAGQSQLPITSPWIVDGSFFGAGDTNMSADNLATTGVENVRLFPNVAEFTLDSAVFVPGKWEIEVKRGLAVKSSLTDWPNYQYNGLSYDLFYYVDPSYTVAEPQEGFISALTFLRSVSVWNEKPVNTDQCALIAVRSRNRSLDKVSCVAGGYTKDWGGSSWNNQIVTSNPAPHLRDVFISDMNKKHISAAILDDATLVAWRADCIANAYRINAVIEGLSVTDAARLIASCGYAAPYMSDLYGVVRDYDRSAEPPELILSAMEVSEFQWSRGMVDIPDYFRVSYRDELLDYEQVTINVPESGSGGLGEEITYEGPTLEAEVIKRANFDRAQAQYRNTFYTCNVGAKSLQVRRGTLIGVNHDVLDRLATVGRLIDWVVDPVTGLTNELILDGVVSNSDRDYLDEITDMSPVPNLADYPNLIGCILERIDGTVTTHRLTDQLNDSNRIFLATPVSPVGLYDGMIIPMGTFGTEYRRLLVWEVTPKADLTANSERSFPTSVSTNPF